MKFNKPFKCFWCRKKSFDTPQERDEHQRQCDKTPRRKRK